VHGDCNLDGLTLKDCPAILNLSAYDSEFSNLRIADSHLELAELADCRITGASSISNCEIVGSSFAASTIDGLRISDSELSPDSRSTGTVWSTTTRTSSCPHRVEPPPIFRIAAPAVLFSV